MVVQGGDVSKWLQIVAALLGAIALIVLSFVYLGVVGAIVVAPIAVVMVGICAFMARDVADEGRMLVRACEERAAILRRYHPEQAADELDRAVAILEAYVDDESAAGEIERLQAQADLDRGTAKPRSTSDAPISFGDAE